MNNISTSYLKCKMQNICLLFFFSWKKSTKFLQKTNSVLFFFNFYERCFGSKYSKSDNKYLKFSKGLVRKTFNRVLSQKTIYRKKRMISTNTFRAKCILKHSQRMPERFLHAEHMVNYKILSDVDNYY